MYVIKKALRERFSYLHKLHQCVKIDNIMTEPTYLEYGVPEGTVQGIYNLYEWNAYNTKKW